CCCLPRLGLLAAYLQMAGCDHSIGAPTRSDIVARRTKRTWLAVVPALALVAAMSACGSDEAGSGGNGDGQNIELVHEGQLTTCTGLPYKPLQAEEYGQGGGFDVNLVVLVPAKRSGQQGSG